MDFCQLFIYFRVYTGLCRKSGSGSSRRTPVRVQIPASAPKWRICSRIVGKETLSSFLTLRGILLTGRIPAWL